MILIVLPDYSVEDELLTAALTGDRDAVLRIYELYFTPVYQFIRLRVGDALVAEDLAADVFVQLVTALRGASPPRTSLRGWLFRVARNLLAAHYRAPRTETELDEWLPGLDDDDPAAQVIDGLTAASTADQVRAALAGLPAEQQEVIVLRFGQQLDLHTTAQIMGKSVNAIKQLQFRAVAGLRRALSRMGEDDR